MDTRLLQHYERELAFMREMGADFAQSFPKIAARLGMEGLEVVDPYVERLLEGVAFLNARIQLELDLQYPHFTSHLLEVLYPHFLGPTPSMLVAQMTPDMQDPALAEGAVLKRGAYLRSKMLEGAQTACTFRTSSDLTMWPVEITEAEYIDGRGELVAAGVATEANARAAIRLRLARAGGGPLGEVGLDRLTLFTGGQGKPGWDLHELLCADCAAVVARSTDRRADWVLPLRGGIAAKGFGRDEALLPTPRPSYDGYRLLQEYFAMPDRFAFAEIRGLAPAMARCEGEAVDLYVLLRHGMSDIASAVTPRAFKLNCVPAINLFEKRCDRVPITTEDVAQHVVPDRTAPLDYEVFSVTSVLGIAGEGEEDVPLRAFYSESEFTAAGGGAQAFYSVSRRMRQRNERERLKGTRTNYLGAELFLSIVDQRQAPYSAGLQQLAVRAMVTNRDLPLLLPTGGSGLFHLPEGGPVTDVTLAVAPTRPRPTLAQGETAWRLISHLSLNYLSLTDTEGGSGAEALRELVGLYAPPGDRVVEKQIEGLAKVSSRPIVRRMTDEVLSTAVRGLEIRIDCDEDYFEGTSAYLLASVLERFFRGYAGINSFTETALVSQQRGEIARWRPAPGSAAMI